MIIALESSLADQATAPFCRTTFFQKYVKIPTAKHGQITVTLQCWRTWSGLSENSLFGFRNWIQLLFSCGVVQCLFMLKKSTVYWGLQCTTTKRKWSWSTGVGKMTENNPWIYSHLTQFSFLFPLMLKWFKMFLV